MFSLWCIDWDRKPLSKVNETAMIRNQYNRIPPNQLLLFVCFFFFFFFFLYYELHRDPKWRCFTVQPLAPPPPHWFMLRRCSWCNAYFCEAMWPCSLFSLVLLSIVLTSLGKERDGIMLLVNLCVYLACITFGIFLFLLVSGVGCGLSLWHSLAGLFI